MNLLVNIFLNYLKKRKHNYYFAPKCQFSRETFRCPLDEMSGHFNALYTSNKTCPAIFALQVLNLIQLWLFGQMLQ